VDAGNDGRDEPFFIPAVVFGMHMFLAFWGQVLKSNLYDGG
jgi:hypothetical protein